MVMSAFSIDLCIPYVSAGLKCLEFFIQNSLSTASHPERINFIISYHSEDDLNHLKSSSCFNKVSKVIFTKPYSENILFFPSANHSLAINNLALSSNSEIVIFSDYDMAFIKSGWDVFIENELLISHTGIAGVAYQPLSMSLNHPVLNNFIPWLKDIKCVKYQNLPNLSFFCIKRDVLLKFFNRRLTNFNEFLLTAGVPFRLINTQKLSTVNNLPLGTMQWLDTGYEIPEIIYDNKIKFRTFIPADYNQQDILDYASSQHNAIFLPEVFFIDPHTPFLCHFKKGTAKMGISGGDFEFDKFKFCVDKFLNN
jgi:hypothetical protein